MIDLPTPETDAAAAIISRQSDYGMSGYVTADFARKLERQRNELLVQLEELKEWAKNWDSPFIDDPAFSWEPIDAAIAKAKGVKL